jgi:hypothetical protein
MSDGVTLAGVTHLRHVHWRESKGPDLEKVFTGFISQNNVKGAKIQKNLCFHEWSLHEPVLRFGFDNKSGTTGYNQTQP